VVFVDVRGFTSLSERLPPGEIVARLNRFYKVAADVVFDLDGTFDKAVGDQVMAFFGAPFRPEDHAQRAVTAAIWIIKTLEDMAEDEEFLRVGGGVGTGETYMGNVAEGEVRDFTVIGDIVNTAARLQSLAGPGEVMIMEDTYKWLTEEYSGAVQSSVEIRGKSEPVAVRVINVRDTE
jgi:adenylate cyclase